VKVGAWGKPHLGGSPMVHGSSRRSAAWDVTGVCFAAAGLEPAISLQKGEQAAVG